jgi:hypothetical protein
MPSEAADFRADILGIAAHRDDVEQTCGGTLLRMAARGLRTAILDLTRGEAGTRGTAEERAREAEEAARILGAGWRDALDLPDGAIANNLENRIAIVRVLRQLRPRVVILPYTVPSKLFTPASTPMCAPHSSLTLRPLSSSATRPSWPTAHSTKINLRAPAFLFLKKRFASAHLPRLATMASWQGFASASRSSRKRSAWSTTSRSCPSNRSKPLQPF